jgi:hypothetical protein
MMGPMKDVRDPLNVAGIKDAIGFFVVKKIHNIIAR